MTPPEDDRLRIDGEALTATGAPLYGSMPPDFIHDFGARAAPLSVLLHVLSVIETTEPLDACQGIIHHLCVLAGTIGLPSNDAPAAPAPDATRLIAGSDKSAA